MRTSGPATQEEPAMSRTPHCPSLLVPLVASLSFALAPFATAATPTTTPSARPNVLLILADDMGFSDLGCYGGEVDTPRLDALASDGLSFSHYRTSPMCVTTRAAILGGMEYNLAGQNDLTRAVPIARTLAKSGYRTALSGKWHLGGMPTDPHMGFGHFFGFTGGQTNCFTGGDDWFRDGQRFTNYGKDFYATDAFADYAIEQIDAADKADQPFFVFLAFNAPHVPLQAPEAEVRKYLDRGEYDDGYVAARKRRMERMVKLGLIPADTEFVPPESDVLPWDLLPPAEKRFQAMKQAAYAAMIDRLDQNVGRVVDDLDRRGQLDNTLIVFASDNGANWVGIDSDRDAVPWDRESRDNPYRQFTSSDGWGYVNNTPFRWYKQTGFEGGVASPLIVHWPRGVSLPKGTRLDQNVTLWDLYPTFLQAAGLTYEPDDPRTRPLMGEPLQPLFADENAPGRDFFISSFTISRGVIMGKYKLTTWLTRPWELYDLETDRVEAHDLMKEKPDVAAKLLATWDAYVKDAGNLGPGWNPEPGQTVYWNHQRMMGGLTRVLPLISDPAAPVDTAVEMQFAGDVVFVDRNGKDLKGRIRLMQYGRDEEVWSADPTPADLVDPRTLRFVIPKLSPSTSVLLPLGRRPGPIQGRENGQRLPRATRRRLRLAVHDRADRLNVPGATTQRVVEDHFSVRSGRSHYTLCSGTRRRGAFVDGAAHLSAARRICRRSRRIRRRRGAFVGGAAHSSEARRIRRRRGAFVGGASHSSAARRICQWRGAFVSGAAHLSAARRI